MLVVPHTLVIFLLICMEGIMWSFTGNVYGVSGAISMAMQTKIHCSKVNFFLLALLKWVPVMKSWHCYRQQHLMWKSLREKQVVFLQRMVSRVMGGGFQSQTVICGEGGTTVRSLCLLLLCPVAVRVVTHGQSFQIGKTSSFIYHRVWCC